MSQISANVDIFVGNDILIDPDIYQLWLNGYSAQEAASLQQRKGNLQHYGATFDMLLSDIMDHYRTFGMLERYLKTPTKLADQLELQITPSTQTMLIERYYEFDPLIVREILGKKLTSRYRNSLDDISEKTHIPLRSCRRQVEYKHNQAIRMFAASTVLLTAAVDDRLNTNIIKQYFDNVKRVYKTIEELSGSLVFNIETHFMLSHCLTQQYAAIVFIANTRFDLSRKKLNYLSFTDFVHCSNMMITHWSYGSRDCKEHDGNDIDLDRDFLQSLRELKVLLDKENLDEHKMDVLRRIDSKLSSESVLADADSNFKVLSKTLVNIASNLNHSKDLKDLFLDLLEKFVEPCRGAGWNQRDVQVFFKAYLEAGAQLPVWTRSSQSLLPIWERYVSTVGSCVVQMYHT